LTRDFQSSGIQTLKFPKGDPSADWGLLSTLSPPRDEGSGQFQFAPGSLPIPRFPLDGILTRHVQLVDPNVKTTARFIELSTPGLRGQSGGPVFDVNGTVWGVQSQTRSLELGFRPSAETKGKKIEENQFLNVGWAAYVSDILKLLDDIGVSYGKA